MSNAVSDREPVEAEVDRTTPAVADRVANDNAAAPIVVLHPTGDGALLYRALARVLVRRELIFANAIPSEGDCEADKAAG